MKVNKDILKDILKLKEKEGYVIGQYFVKRKGEDLIIEFNVDSNFYFIIDEMYTSKLVNFNLKLISLYKEELENMITEDLNQSILLLEVIITAKEGHNCILMSCPLLSKYKEIKYNDSVKRLENEMSVMLNEMNANLIKLLDTFVIENENVKHYEWIFKKINKGNYIYMDFVRQVNGFYEGNISQQKEENRELIKAGYGEKIIEKLKNMKLDSNYNKINVRFSLDRNNIIDLNVSYYPTLGKSNEK